MISARAALLFSVVVAGGCKGDEALGVRADASTFELECRASNTATAAELFCIRTDTRTGEIVRVRHENLPVSNGPTASAAGDPGRYRTVCDATSTTTRSELYCIRLNTGTGEMMLVNLQKIPSIPDAKRP